jgi:hypothetical protein
VTSKSVPLYLKEIVPFLKLRDLLAVPANDGKTRTVIPPPGQFLQATQQPTGIIVRLEHRPDGLFLVINDDLTYPIIAQPMPRLLWHLYPAHPSREPRPLHPGDPSSRYPQPPARYVIRDSLGNNVKSLFLHIKTGRICSRYESQAAGVWLYHSYHLKPSAREQRRLDKMFTAFPERQADVLDFRNSIAKLMSLRPYDMNKDKWMRLILRARYGFSGADLETETTAALMDYRHRPANRTRRRPHFHRTLGQFNQIRRQEKARLELLAEPLPLGYHT